MKNLLACLAILAAFNVTAQTETSNFPYNPDVDQDGFIGVNDILQLLSTFGEAFQVQVTLNADSTSAIYIPDDWTQIMTSTQCASRCDSLPGPWHIMTYQGFIEHFSLLRETLQSTSNSQGYASGRFWQLNPAAKVNNRYSTHTIITRSTDNCYGSYFPDGSCTHYNGAYENNSLVGEDPNQCLCELRQRPRVEYDFCEGSMTAVQSCAAGKVNSGWYPLELTSAGSNTFVQTFWRWED